MNIIWLGHSSFRIEIGNQVLLVDPWLTGNPMLPEFHREKAIAGATHILVSHGHDDHSGDAVAISKELSIPVVGIYDLMSWWEGQHGIDHAIVGAVPELQIPPAFFLFGPARTDAAVRDLRPVLTLVPEQELPLAVLDVPVSLDTVAVDTVGATIMGFDSKEIDYIQLAGEQDLGCAELSEIEIVGVLLEEAVHPFKTLKVDFEEFEKKLGIKIIEDGACSGCNHVIDTLLSAYMKKSLGLLKGHTLIFGQTVKVPPRVEGKLLCLGACTRKYKNEGHYFPGCPPMQDDVLEYFGLDPDSWQDGATCPGKEL